MSAAVYHSHLHSLKVASSNPDDNESGSTSVTAGIQLHGMGIRFWQR